MSRSMAETTVVCGGKGEFFLPGHIPINGILLIRAASQSVGASPKNTVSSGTRRFSASSAASRTSLVGGEPYI